MHDTVTRNHRRRVRCMDVVLGDEIPGPRDVAIICLAEACSLWRGWVHGRELVRLGPRIAQVARLDLIGQSVTRTIRELQAATRGAETQWFS